MVKCQSFVFFRDWDPSKRDEGLKELMNNGIKYIMLSGPYRLSTIVHDDKLAREAEEFIEYAYDEFNIQSIIFAGKRVSDDLFIDRGFVELQSDMIARGMEKLRNVRGLYALYIEDEPYLSWDLTPSKVRDKYNDLFESETGCRLPERGKVKGKWNFKTAMTYCHWVSEKYLYYIGRIIEKYKKVCPHVKSAINLHIGGVFPSADNPVDVQGIIELVDILITDIYPGWHQMLLEIENMTDFRTKLLRCITDKPLWNILQGHLVIPGYAPTLQQMERWALVSVENGWDAVGWYANDHNFAPYIRVNIKTEYTKYACRERWNKMMEISKKITSIERKKPRKSNICILASFDSILAYGRMPLLYAYITLHVDGGMEVDFLTERMIDKENNILENYQYLFLGSSPIVRETIIPVLKNFITNGGILIGSCQDMLYNEKGESLSKIRARLFGVEEEKVFYLEDSIHLSRRVGGLEEGSTLPCFWERRAVKKTLGSVDVLGVWSNGYPAIILKKYGKGKVIYIGTRPYRANCQRRARIWAKFMKEIIISKI